MYLFICDFQIEEELRMDIFTTQLTRVVPVPIKPASLKVKALLKEAANSKLSQDSDHIENHEYYFTTEEDQYHSSQQEAKQDNKEEQHAQQETVIKEPESKDAELSAQESAQQSTESEKSDGQADQKKNKPKHLDLYA